MSQGDLVHYPNNLIDRLLAAERRIDDLERKRIYRFGDVTGSDYAEFAANGFITLAGDARVYKGLWVDAGGIKSPGAKPATAIAHGTLETPAWQFGNEAVAGNQESVSFAVRVPYQMDITAAPLLYFGWSTTTADPGDDSEVLEMQLEYLWTALDEDTTAAAQETLTGESVASTVAEGMVMGSITGIDAPGSTDVCIHCKLKRLSAGANDTIADDIELHGICFIYTANDLGGDIT